MTRVDNGAHDDAAARQSGLYVYGIVDAATPLPADLPTVGDAQSEVRAVPYGRISALTSELRLTRPLGTRDDLVAHETVLDAVAATATVLPVRFGGVLTDVDGLTTELLSEHHDRFSAALSELAGLVQFTVRGRYVDEAHLREIVIDNAEVAELRAALRKLPEDAGYFERIRLGELVHQAVVEKRAADTVALLEALQPYVAASARRDLDGQDDAVDVALLVAREHVPQFEQALEEFGARRRGRVQLRLTGPMAPYDFVPEA